jgi:hypothetical protein
MFGRIKRRKLRKDHGTTRYAMLVRSVWEQGRPPQKVVRYLARIQECYLTAPAHRQLFWLRVDAHLADPNSIPTHMHAVSSGLPEKWRVQVPMQQGDDLPPLMPFLHPEW